MMWRLLARRVRALSKRVRRLEADLQVARAEREAFVEECIRIKKELHRILEERA